MSPDDRNGLPITFAPAGRSLVSSEQLGDNLARRQALASSQHARIEWRFPQPSTAVQPKWLSTALRAAVLAMASTRVRGMDRIDHAAL